MSSAVASHRIAVIVPSYNAANLLPRVLAPLRAMLERHEIASITVVDDCSTDSTRALFAALPDVRYLRTPQNGGPGVARNLAAQSTEADYLWFVDSDVIVAPDAARVLHESLRRFGPAAVMGSYDDAPDARNFLSQYKNLVHHYYHQAGRAEASTFWAGCGAVRRDVFLQVGGFDVKRFRHPSVEDIELGYRIRDAGGRIRLERALQGRHLKRWRLGNLLHTEIFRRAAPWAQLMLERRSLTNDLNVSRTERVRAAITGAVVGSTAAWAAGVASGSWPAGLALLCLASNLRLTRFFSIRRGPVFAARAFSYHQLYYLYGAATFGCVALRHTALGLRRLVARESRQGAGGIGSRD